MQDFSSQASLTIGKLALQAGIQTSAIRYYESVGLLPVAQRVNGQRYYESSALQRLSFIKLSQQAGFTVAEIGTLLEGFEENIQPSVRWRKMAADKLPEVEKLILRAQKMKALLEEGLRCNCLNFEECLPNINSETGCCKQ